MLNKGPYQDIGNPEMIIHPHVMPEFYMRASEELKLQMEIFNLTAFNAPRTSVLYLPPQGYWWMV